MRERVASWRKEMFGCAVVRRAVVLIAAPLLLVVPARAQSQADVVVEKFAREPDHAQVKNKEATRKADEAKAKKDAERKAAQAEKALKIRKDAEAQRAKAIERLKAEETGAIEEKEMLSRARQEAEEDQATAEIRRLIEQAEAARIRAEDMLAQEDEQTRVKTAQPARTTEQEKQGLNDAAERRARKTEAELAKVAESPQQTALRLAENRNRLSKLARVRQLRGARLAAQTRRVAQEAEVARTRADAEAHVARLRAAENRDRIKQLARVRRLREGRLASQQQAQRVAQDEAHRHRLEQEATAAARVRAAEEAQVAALQQAQRLAQEEAQRQRLAQEVAAVERVRAAEETRLAAPISRDEAESRTAAAAKELSLRTAEAQPPASTVASPNAPIEPPASALLMGRAGLGGDPDRRVAVLMIMTPGAYGIRRGANIADPVLCAIDGCYVSAGADRAAIFMPRRRALGVGNTLGGRAGACRQSLSCVFRGVELDFPGALQPVDLHILKHDRRRPQMITDDSDCRLVAGRLACNRGIYAEDYALWIVPEWLATTAGPEVMERALREGLSVSRSAEVSPRSMR